MADIQTQISEARKAGYDDAAIAAHLTGMPEYGSKMKTAFDAGYKPTEILAYLTPTAAPVSEIPKDRGVVGMAGDVLAGAVRGAGSLGATIMAPFDVIAQARGKEIPFFPGRLDDRR